MVIQKIYRILNKSKYVIKRLFTFFLLICTVSCFSGDIDPERYVDAAFLDTLIANRSSTRVLSDIRFEESKLQNIQLIGSKLLSNENGNDFYEYRINYKNFLFLLLTEKVNEIQLLRDTVVRSKISDKSYLARGPVEINGEYFDWDVVVVVDNPWTGKYTVDISAAYKSNLKTRTIDTVDYNSIRLYREE